MEGKEFENIIGQISQITEIINTNNGNIQELGQVNKTLENDIYRLRIKLQPICTHEYGRVYKQQISPSAKVNAQRCKTCLHTKYLNNIIRSNSKDNDLLYH